MDLDLRRHRETIKDQGRRGTCVACAATAGHEMLREDSFDLSIEFLHWAAKRRDGLPPSSEGTTLPAAREALGVDGQPLEALWPYDDTRDQRLPTYQPPSAAVKEALQRLLTNGEEIPATGATVRDGLTRGRPVVLGLRIHTTWFVVGADGRVALPGPSDRDFGGHAVLVVGLRGNEFIIRNSWGSDWGEDGYGFLPSDYIDQHGIAAWTMAL